jgi:glycosyltransferase involved in cell wall biosynthesis
MVSVIIPAYNAARTISRCLESLMEQDCAEDYEVIVIDDGSTDSTPQTVSKFNNVRLIRQKNAGPAAARNRGAAEAKGEIILFTDADCFPEHNWISEMLRPFNENPDIVGVKGSYKTRQEEIIARFVQLEYEDKYERMMKERYIDFIDTYSAGFRKKIFLDMNGYDTDFPVACAEDVELSFRMSNQGYKMVFNPKAVVYHMHPDTLSAYLGKKYKFAFWRIVALKKNPNKAVKDSHTPQLMKVQLLFPPLIFTALLYSGFSETGVTATLLLLSFFIFTTFPFILNAIKKDALLALLTPSLLFLRSAAQCAGVAGGIVYSLKRGKLRH